jgi:hypothetical protein
MSDANRRHKINKVWAKFGNASIEYWLLHEEYELKKDTLEPLEVQCAIDALYSMMYHRADLRQQLLDLGVSEDDLRRPPFFPLG